MEKKFTKGEFMIETGDKGLNNIYIETESEVIAKMFFCITLPREEALANAKLFAAAPDLLEALQEARVQIKYLHEKFSETGTGNAVLAKIETAIKKATA